MEVRSLKRVTIIGDESPTKTLITAVLGDRMNIKLSDYTVDALRSVILDDQIDAAIYMSGSLDIAIEATEEIERMAIVRSASQLLILVGEVQFPQVNVDMYIPTNQFGESKKAINQAWKIRACIETGVMKLPELSSQQMLVLEIHCSLLPEKEAIKKSKMSKRNYYRVLGELQGVFSVFDNCELRQIFCSSQIPSLVRDLSK
jgi:hypothetical protein